MVANKILKEFVNEVIKKTSVNGIIQFGYSTYLENPNDMDIILYWDKLLHPLEEYADIRNLILKFEKDYPVSFDIDGVGKKPAKYCIAIVIIDKDEISKPLAQFANFDIKNDKNRRCLYGIDPFKELRVRLTKKLLIDRLTHSIQFGERFALRDLEDGVSYLLKSTLRIMLLLAKKHVTKKMELIAAFKQRYPRIKLPKNVKGIINHAVSEEDLKPVLKFAEDCFYAVMK